MQTPTILGERVKTARLNTGLTQEKLATMLDVSRPAISEIESGKRDVSASELVQLARMLKKPLTYFVEETESAEQELVTILYRADELTEDDRPKVDDAVLVCKDYHKLESITGSAPKGLLPRHVSPILSRNDVDAQGSRIARKLRLAFDLGNSPIRNLASILEDYGVKVIQRPLTGSGVWGFSLSSKEIGDSIFINTNCTKQRQNFTLAHELGHLVMDELHDVTISSEKRSGGAGSDSNLSELRANAFAASFLMPDAGIENRLCSLGLDNPKRGSIGAAQVDFLRSDYGVSFEAMVYRLRTLKYLTQTEVDELLKQKSSDPSDKSEPRALPARYELLALQAYQQMNISIGKLSEYLRLDLYETRDLLAARNIYQEFD